MATTKIKVYNTALRHLGITRLHSTDGLTENRQERREIDQVYDDSLTEMLEKAIWYFALKRVRMDADPEIETQFGRQFAYSQPDDMVDHGLHGITVDERGEQEIDWRPANGLYICDESTIYFSYVSDAETHGRNLGLMSQHFGEAWGSLIALKTNLPVTGSRGDRNDLIAIHGKLLDVAKTREAVNQPIKTRPAGNWSSSRGRGRGRVIIRGGNIRWGG